MTTKVIIYPEEATISVIAPYAPVNQDESEADYLARIAANGVPAGIAYRIIERADLPEDGPDRHRWTADFSTPDGYGG